MKFMHVETGSVDTKEGWIASYSQEELDERELTAVQAFEEDEGATLIRVKNINGQYVAEEG